MVRLFRLCTFIDQCFVDHFFYKIIFFINNIFFITPVSNPCHIDGILFHHRIILFKHLDGVPAHIVHLRIFLTELLDDRINLILYLIVIHHGILAVVIVFMSRLIRMMMDERSLLCIFLVMRHRMEQDFKPRAFSRRYRDRRNAEHLRKTVKVDLHSPLFYDIHHIECQNHRFPKLNEL